jgi:hypothetical protein
MSYYTEQLAQFVTDNAAALEALPADVVQELRGLSESLANEAARDEQRAKSERDDGPNGYLRDVDTIAAECIENAIENNPDDEDEAREAAFEQAWEDVDSSQWIIYTARNYVVLQATNNDDAWQEFGELDPTKAIAQMAMAAMVADVRDEIRNTFDAAWEAHEDAKQEAEDAAQAAEDAAEAAEEAKREAEEEARQEAEDAAEEARQAAEDASDK